MPKRLSGSRNSISALQIKWPIAKICTRSSLCLMQSLLCRDVTEYTRGCLIRHKTGFGVLHHLCKLKGDAGLHATSASWRALTLVKVTLFIPITALHYNISFLWFCSLLNHCSTQPFNTLRQGSSSCLEGNTLRLHYGDQMVIRNIGWVCFNSNNSCIRSW